MAFHLISVGISKYARPNYLTLGYAADDAGDFSNLIRQNIPLELDILLRNSEASLVEINTALDSDILKNATKEDTFLLFFSGHGGAEMSDKGSYEAYLVPFDGNDDLDISGISASQIQNLVAGLKHGTKIILLDCCYSGGANAKSISNIQYKDMTTLKAFQNQTYAEGTFVFTACKEDERAIELADLKHGLFTYYLLEEMSKDRRDDTLPLSDLCHPVINKVIKAASQNKHTQTPTIKLNASGSVTLPSLKKPKPLKPGIIKVPTQEAGADKPLSPPEIEITDKKTKELINDTLKLIENAGSSKLSMLAFRSTLSKILDDLKKTYEELPKQASTQEELHGMVIELEAQSYQLMVVSACVALTGNEDVLRRYCQSIAQILNWKNGKSGLVAALETPDVIFVAIIYLVTMVSIYTDDYKPLNALLKNYYTDTQRDKLLRVVDAYHIHYADSLGGNAMTVFKHIIELMKKQKWLCELLGLAEEEVKNLVLQSNMLITVISTHLGNDVYPSFGSFYASRVSPLADMIANDAKTQEQMAQLLDCRPDEVCIIFARMFRVFIERMSRGFFWDSVNYNRFLKEGEELHSED